MHDNALTSRRIVVFGDVIDDIVVIPQGPILADTDTPSSIQTSCGGSAANVASWMATLGSPVDFVGVVAESDLARHQASLEACGVTQHLHGHATLPTGKIVIIVDGEQRTMLTETGANRAMSPRLVPDELLDGAYLLHFTGYSLFGMADDSDIRDLIERCSRRGVIVSVDPGSAGFLVDYGQERFLAAVRGASMIFPNLDEGRILTGLIEPEGIAAALLEHFELAAVTLDAHGVTVARRGRAVIHSEPNPVSIIDPTGAGDAFAAGFLSAWVRTNDDSVATMAGIAAGALAVGARGGRPPA